MKTRCPSWCDRILLTRSFPEIIHHVRDWSLITGRRVGVGVGVGVGGLQNGRRGPVKFYPYEKGGGGKSFSHAEGGGHNKFWGSFYMLA